MMECAARVIISQPARLQCTFKGFQTKLCVGPSLPPLKDQHEYGSTRYLQTLWVLSKNWVNNFIGGKRHKRSSSSLLTIEQGENESLQSFIARFNKEPLTVDEMDDKLLLAAFHNGVNFNLFIHKLYELEPQTMAELVHSAQTSWMQKMQSFPRKRRKLSKWKQISHAILNRVFVQRRPKQEKRRIETTRRRVRLQEEVSTTHPWMLHLIK